MVWPFSRARAERHGVQRPEQVPARAPENGIPASAAPATPAHATSDAQADRKRRRSTEYPFDRGEVEQAQPVQHRPRPSVENITALPGARRLETSPHLRQSRLMNTAIPYNSTNTKSAMPVPDKQKRRLSKRQIYHDRAIREEEIRAMSSPVAVPKRAYPNGDLLAREEKKAHRPFSRGRDDTRDSIISLPVPDSIHSSMSAGSDSRWEIPKLNLLNPRPSIRIHSSLGQHSNSGPEPRLYRAGSKRKDKEKMSTREAGGKRKDRRRVADLADDLDATDLRAAMERESRRREVKEAANRDKVAAKLRRRTSRSRPKERDPPVPDISQHPAFRTQPQAARSASRGRSRADSFNGEAATAVVNAPPTEDPFRDPSPSLFAYQDALTPGGTLLLETPLTGIHTPLGSTFEDAVLVTAEEVRYSQGRFSQVDMLPPDPPYRHSQARGSSPLRREFTPDSLSASPPIRNDSADNGKAGSWMGIFRRGARTSTPPPVAGSSFSNLSRDSMSRQPVPAHLIANQARRRSNTPARTTSIFREDLPETSSATEAKSVSPELVIMPAHTALASPPASSPPAPDVTDGPLSTSLASVDSEASWLSRRPVRDSNGTGRSDQSYEDLGPHFQGLGSAENGGPAGLDQPLHRSTSRRKPTLVLRETQGGMAAVMGGQTPTTEPRASGDDSDGSASAYGTEDEGEAEVVYGHGRQISTGSAKLLEIPSRTKSGRLTEGRAYGAAGRVQGLRTPPPESPEIVLER